MNGSDMSPVSPRRHVVAVDKPDLPLQCRKCGCHRTRVVGKPAKSALRFVRCLECDTTSAFIARTHT
jgi:hypothetical protein